MVELSRQFKAPATLSRVKTAGSHWAKPTADLDALEKRKISLLIRK
jgi:hypothetical protein